MDVGGDAQVMDTGKDSFTVTGSRFLSPDRSQALPGSYFSKYVSAINGGFLFATQLPTETLLMFPGEYNAKGLHLVKVTIPVNQELLTGACCPRSGAMYPVCKSRSPGGCLHCYGNRSCFRGVSHYVWTCDCRVSSHVSNLLRDGDWRARNLAGLSAGLQSLPENAGLGCIHLEAGRSVLVALQDSNKVLQAVSELPPSVTVLEEPSFVASVVHEGLHRVFVRETVQHHLECSRCGQRGYVCDHSKLAYAVAPERIKTRLKIRVDESKTEKKIHKQTRQPTVASLQSDIKSSAGVPFAWPKQLRPQPQRGVLHKRCGCNHAERCCMDGCDCKGNKLHEQAACLM
jgi:hypothetical protein